MIFLRMSFIFKKDLLMKIKESLINKIAELREIIHMEFSNYSIEYSFCDVEVEDEIVYIEVLAKWKFPTDAKTNDLKFKIEDDKIFIEMAEDSYDEIEKFHYSIKYLWIAFLK